MKKLTLSILATALVVASAPAFADPPNGSLIYKSNNGKDTQALANSSLGNKVGDASAQIIQNGQFVSQQAQSGQRAANVQQLLGH